MTNDSLRLGFAGTPEIAAVVLADLLAKSVFPVDMVYTQPDRPAGRGKQPSASAVKKLAVQHDLQPRQPETPADLLADRDLSGLDVLVVIAYGMLLPEEVLKRPRLGCINIHTSLLPRWRGAAPIQRAIEAGDTRTGITIIQMEKGLDTGPVLFQKSCPIAVNETAGSLHDKLATLGSECLLDLLPRLANGEVKATPQDHTMATYARKITKDEARLDWHRQAIQLERQIRAFNPAPVASMVINQQIFRIWESEVQNDESSSVPGTVVAFGRDGLDIQTGKGILRVKMIQAAGRKKMSVQEFLNGKPGFFQQGQICSS